MTNFLGKSVSDPAIVPRQQSRVQCEFNIYGTRGCAESPGGLFAQYEPVTAAGFGADVV